jgi:hypothetical protein
VLDLADDSAQDGVARADQPGVGAGEQLSRRQRRAGQGAGDVDTPRRVDIAQWGIVEDGRCAADESRVTRGVRYRANLRTRYASQLRGVRAEAAALARGYGVDELGRVLAEFVAGYRQRHGAGPARSQLVAETDLLSLVGLPQPPADWPRQARAMWTEVGVSAIFQEVRRAGWLRWTREPGSVRAGGAYADAARGMAPAEPVRR